MTEAMARVYKYLGSGIDGPILGDLVEEVSINENLNRIGRFTWLESLEPPKRIDHVHHDSNGNVLYDGHEIQPGSVKTYIEGTLVVVVAHFPYLITE